MKKTYNKASAFGSAKGRHAGSILRRTAPRRKKRKSVGHPPGEPERRMFMNRKKLETMVLTAMLVALMLALNVSGLGMIRLGVIDLTTYCVVVIVGTLMLGWRSGLVLGTAFGLMSFWTAMTAPSAMVMPVVGWSPLAALVMSVLPRACIPIITHGISKVLQRMIPNRTVAVGAAAVSGSLTNTILYLGTMLLMYTMMGRFSTEFVASLGTIVFTNGLLEAAAAGVISMPIVAALRRIKR